MMTTATDHPDFTAAPPQRRWAGNRLRGLFVLLDQELQTKPDRVRAWRVLRGGAQVSLERTGGRRILRIARSEGFTTPDGPARWSAELATFQREFGCTMWEREDEPDAVGVAARFHEPLQAML